MVNGLPASKLQTPASASVNDNDDDKGGGGGDDDDDDNDDDKGGGGDDDDDDDDDKDCSRSKNMPMNTSNVNYINTSYLLL